MDNTKSLKNLKCVPCEGGIRPLSEKEIKGYLSILNHWRWVPEKGAICTEITAKDFMSAVQWIHKIAVLAEKEGHHPDLHLTRYRHLTVELSTHAIKGLSMNDFALATKIEKLNPSRS